MKIPVHYFLEKYENQERERGREIGDLLTHGVAFGGDVDIGVELVGFKGLEAIFERKIAFKFPRVSDTRRNRSV